MPGNDAGTGVGHGEHAIAGRNHAVDIAVAVHVNEGIEAIEEIVAHVKDIGVLKMQDHIAVGMSRPGVEGVNGFPFQCSVSSSLKVTIGRAASGDGGIAWLKISRNCSVLMRTRTLSWATMTAPASPKASLPPV